MIDDTVISIQLSFLDLKGGSIESWVFILISIESHTLQEIILDFVIIQITFDFQGVFIVHNVDETKFSSFSEIEEIGLDNFHIFHLIR